jgi:hypothetical protein
MKLARQREIYRVAFDAANSELTEINAEFESLRIRKDQVERLIVVLRPLIGEEESAGTVSLAEGASPEAPATGAETSGESNREPQPVPSDPFQRRIDHVLGIGAGIRDVRKYTRQF